MSERIASWYPVNGPRKWLFCVGNPVYCNNVVNVLLDE